MRQAIIKMIGFLALMVVLMPMAHADFLGVEDAALLAKAIEQLEQLQDQYKLLNDTYVNAQSQLENLKSLKDYNSGTYGYGAFNNGLDALKDWQNPADNWKEALEHIAGGNQGRYKELVESYEASHPMVSDKEFAKGVTTDHLTQYQYNKKFNKAMSVETTKTYNDINTCLKNIQTLALKIDQTPNTKSALDLNSRLTAELAYISVMNLKLQTLMSQQLAQTSANELAEVGEMARFNQLKHQ